MAWFVALKCQLLTGTNILSAYAAKLLQLPCPIPEDEAVASRHGSIWD
jgi:hypothetical protein